MHGSGQPRTPDVASDVVVVGGGIGGLAAAYALARDGHQVRVLEHAPEFGEVGAGLQLAPNATRVLREWGLLDEVVAAGVLPRRLVLRDAVDGGELTHLDLGDGFRRRYGAPYVVVHRSDLHAILAAACRTAGAVLETDRHVERVETRGDTATTHCAGGVAYHSAAVVAADGLTSTLRGAVVDDAPVPSGYVAYRGAVPADSVTVDVDMDDVVAWVGPGCHLVQYPLRGGGMVNQVAVFSSPGFARGMDDWGGPDELDEAFTGCCRHVRESLALLWRDRRWPMYDREPTPRWVAGRMVLVGDAAHPMLQYLAQGACQAIEDAHALAAGVAKHSTVTADDRSGVDWDAALETVHTTRATHTARVQRTARLWGEMWHLDGVARLVRNELLRTRDPHDYHHIDWLYSS